MEANFRISQDCFEIVKIVWLEPGDMKSDLQRGDETPATDFYLPATPSMSSTPGIVETFLTTLFRRRGTYRVVTRRKGQ